MNQARVVLVRPRIAANIGAAARVMRNFGLSDLVLVNPIADPSDANARQVATQGEEILDRCRIAAHLEEAVSDCVLVVGTSARRGGLFRKQSAGEPEDVMPRLIASLASGPVALVFGPEPTGLTNPEVTLCHWLLHLPTHPAYPALNLAQAVAICLYELHRHVTGTHQATYVGAATVEKPAAFAEFEPALAHLKQALEAVHFLYGEKAEPLWHGVRHLLVRANPTAAESRLLHGLARQLLWVAREYNFRERGASAPGCGDQQEADAPRSPR